MPFGLPEPYDSFAVILAYILGGFVLHWFIKRILLMAGKKYQPHALHWVFLDNISKVLIFIAVVYACLASVPQLKSVSTVLLTGSSILVAAIGLASQKSLANGLGGVIISLTKPFAVGDRVRLIKQNVTGFVENVNTNHTIIRTVENNRLLIPNASVLDDVIENLNHTDTRICNFLDVGIDFGADIGLAKKTMADIITKHPLWVDTRTEDDRINGLPPVRVLVRDISDRRIELRAGVWSGSIADSFILCSDVRKEIVESFIKINIKLYCPIIKTVVE
jgi:small-conductance mechanosensitive channel